MLVDMPMVPLKRRRANSSVTVDSSSSSSSSNKASKFPKVVIFLLERKMGATRRAFLTQLGRSKGFQVDESYSHTITHIVSEKNSGDEVRTWLDLQMGGGAGRTGGEERTGERERKTVDDGRSAGSVHLLDISWYTESMRVGSPVNVLDQHRLQERQKCGVELAVVSVPSYACQRRTPLLHHNTLLTDALAILAESAELNKNEGRAVAFRRAAAVLKSLPQPVRRAAQLKGLPCLGEHSLRVIKEILEDGVAREVETTKHCEQFKAMKILTGIFGVGSKTADRWFRENIHTLSDLQRSGHTLNRAQQAGLHYYDDLNLPVTKAEADAIGQIVERAVHAVLPGAEITLIGGFRRGKQTGHDVDFLITHPEEGREEGLMPKVVSWLESQGFLLYQKTNMNSYLEAKEGPARPSSNMDRFERCLSIFRLTKDRDEGETQGTTQAEIQRERQTQTRVETDTERDMQTQTENGSQTFKQTQVSAKTTTHPNTHTKNNTETQTQSNTDSHTLPHLQTHPAMDDDHAQEGSSFVGKTQGSMSRSWRAVRVDLVVSPYSQYAFALLGWTGSKLFERELRRWAGQERAMSLSSHALYDSKQGMYLRANSEEEIFAHLGLEYIPPCERNA